VVRILDYSSRPDDSTGKQLSFYTRRWIPMAARFRLCPGHLGRTLHALSKVLSEETAGLTDEDIWDTNPNILQGHRTLAGEIRCLRKGTHMGAPFPARAPRTACLACSEGELPADVIENLYPRFQPWCQGKRNPILFSRPDDK